MDTKKFIVTELSQAGVNNLIDSLQQIALSKNLGGISARVFKEDGKDLYNVEVSGISQELYTKFIVENGDNNLNGGVNNQVKIKFHAMPKECGEIESDQETSCGKYADFGNSHCNHDYECTDCDCENCGCDCGCDGDEDDLMEEKYAAVFENILKECARMPDNHLCEMLEYVYMYQSTPHSDPKEGYEFIAALMRRYGLKHIDKQAMVIVEDNGDMALEVIANILELIAIRRFTKRSIGRIIA